MEKIITAEVDGKVYRLEEGGGCSMCAADGVKGLCARMPADCQNCYLGADFGLVETHWVEAVQ